MSTTKGASEEASKEGPAKRSRSIGRMAETLSSPTHRECTREGGSTLPSSKGADNFTEPHTDTNVL